MTELDVHFEGIQRRMQSARAAREATAIHAILCGISIDNLGCGLDLPGTEHENSDLGDAENY